MKFTLKDYQEEAVADVLVNLRKARKRWHEDQDKQAFSLTATTGAGKTVMAAAVIEALFHGSADFEFEPDRGAVVIWFSDDPSLNEQSKYRLMEASDKLTVSDLVTVESSFGRERFEPGKVYFLNTQKLSRNSLLVRGHDDDENAIVTDDGRRLLPDARSHTIWDTIQNTIEDPELTLYLVLDEAHRGMRGTATGRQTIVTRLIGGQGRVPGIPVVWGISATVERFDNAIRDIPGLSTLPNVVVDSKKVQDSGLLKDTINLDVPEESGDFSTVLLRRGTAKLREISKAWTNYAKLQDAHKAIKPLMVLQVPNSPDHDEIGLWLQTIFHEWPELDPSSIANVFGEHKNEGFGPYAAPYIAPERVQEADWVRILIAKDAISTGWDCPRAEVMVSFRAASDDTHITQLLGRMVRTPLARRIPGNELLNSVDCLLPHFNRKTVERVVDLLIHGGELGGDGTGRRVLINPVDMLPNPNISEAVWQKLESLPSQSPPKRQAKPVKRLTILAHRLAVDGLLPDAGKEAHRRMHSVLDGLAVTYSAQIQEARDSVLQVEGATLVADVYTQQRSFNDFVEDADFAVIDDAYRRASRAISPDLAKTYSEHLAAKNEDAEDDEEALIEAHTHVAALGLVPDIKAKLDAAADELAEQWLTQYRVAIKSLKDDRQDAYRDIRAMSTDPMDIDLVRPKVWQQQTKAKNPDGQTVDLPKYENHLMCDSDGLFPGDLNADEVSVLTTEMNRTGFVAWYRNPPVTNQQSLGISYEIDGVAKIVRPDFICFSEIADGSLVADIVDPHGTYLSDALPKLQGLARYAEKHAGMYRRIDSIAKMPSGNFKVLDMTEASVRDAVLTTSSARNVFASPVASDFTG
ncbi:DEAD/DEAH box helicase [Henriciella marina]|uniref:DEAD/DEAH box helicase n=1 Tax=Henriciella marina TaxID=453851 RepID=UPI00036F1F96|nr:DEAD/DEAH box helicase family protein [Henriciella marina]